MFVRYISKEDTHKGFFGHEKKVSKTQDTEAKHSEYTRKKSSQYLEMKSAFAFLNKQKDFFFFLINTRSSVDNLSVYGTASVTDIKAKALDNDI